MRRLLFCIVLPSLLLTSGCLEEPVLCSSYDGCGANAICTDTDDGPTCSCDSGFEGDGASCEDVDECLTDNGGCDLNASCINSVGANSCACNQGWEGDGLTCSDVDECLTDNGGCDLNAICTNTDGSNSCACGPGWEGDGLLCTDIDECLTDNGGCDLNAICTNTDGSRSCDCIEGWQGDGETCEPIPPSWVLVAHVDGIPWNPNHSVRTMMAVGSSIYWGPDGGTPEDYYWKSYDTVTGQITNYPADSDDFCACGYTQTSVVLGYDIYIFGNSGWLFDTALEMWSIVNYPWDNRRGEAASAAIDGDIYLFGGRGPLDSTQRYTGGVNGTWMDVAPIPYAVDFAGAVEHDGLIYLLGGINEAQSNSRAARYDPTNDSWEVLANPPVDEGWTSIVGLLQGEPYMQQWGLLYPYDTTSESWLEPIAMPEGLDQALTVDVLGDLYAMGGDGNYTEVYVLTFP